MNESKNCILSDKIEPISNAIQKNIPETVLQTDGVLSTLIGFLNHVILYPVKVANLKFRYKLKVFEDKLKKRMKHISLEDL